MKPLVIYIAGPYSAETHAERIVNTERAMQAGHEVLQRGHWPFIPHLLHFFDDWRWWQHHGRLGPEDYMQWDFATLRRCDALLYVAPSPGADRELALARELRLPIYLSADDIPAIQERT